MSLTVELNSAPLQRLYAERLLRGPSQPHVPDGKKNHHQCQNHRTAICPVSFKTLIEIFENIYDYPEKFQKLVLGKTEMKIRGESCSECCCSPIYDDDTKWKPYQRIKCGYCGDFFCSRQLFYKHANKVHRYYLT